MQMKVPSAILRSLIISLIVLGTTGPLDAAANTNGDVASVKSNEAIKMPARFDELAAKAKQHGASDQSILEAKLISCIRNETFEEFPTLLPRVEACLSGWKESESLFFENRN